MTMLSRNDQKGRSMVEMLGVLAIIGVLSVGGISGYSKAMAKFKLTKAQDQITMLLMNIRTAFATSPSYSGLTTATSREYNIAPGDMFGANSTLNNAFGGKAYVYACDGAEATGDLVCVEDAAGSPQYFAIHLTNLGREACISLASSDWGTDGLIAMKITSDDGDADPKTNLAADLPLSTMGVSVTTGNPGAGKQCGKQGSYNTITWVYY